MEASEFAIITTTTDTKENARIITKVLLEKKLIACAQCTATQSSYRWQGKIIEDEEIYLQMKTKQSLFSNIKKEIESLHTYETPEIIMTPLLDANLKYLQWIEDETD
ncbi:MAG TPA: divalent-cation tolerance protein CutA [Sulfurovum sp.]|nr:divalent-cation tolerance protein CutA [Sulfurovum sp.]